jgi:hypothetical protein
MSNLVGQFTHTCFRDLVVKRTVAGLRGRGDMAWHGWLVGGLGWLDGTGS